MTADERIDALIALLAANGMSIPKELRKPDPLDHDGDGKKGGVKK